MTINYTTLLGLAKPVTGTESGQWGDVVNDQITTLVEDAVANASSISVTAGNVTLTTTTGAANQARMSTLIITGTPGTTRNVVAPSQAKVYVVINQSNAAVVVKGAATTGVTIGAGQTAQIAWNGSDFVEIGNYVHGNFVVNGNLSVNGNSTLGDGGADITTINGQFVGANANISKATTLSTSAPAFFWLEGATYTDTGTAGGTTQPHATFHQIDAPTVNTSNIVTYTNASTLYIAGAPSAAGSATITNPYALFINGGASYFGAAVTMAATTQNLALGTSQTSGTWTAGGAAQTGTITLDQSTKAHTLNLGTGATENATTKTINLGTAGVSGSTTTINIGSAVSGSTTSVTINGGSTTTGAVTYSATTQNIALGTSQTSGTWTAGGAAQTGTITLDQSTKAHTLNIGTGATENVTTKTINIGTAGVSGSTTNLTYGSGVTGSTTTHIWNSGGTEGMRLNSTGLGVGTNSPGAKLDVSGSVNAVQARFGNVAGRGLEIGTSIISGTNDAGSVLNAKGATSGTMIFQTDSTERMRLDFSGNLGIGTSSIPAGRRLVVAGGSVRIDNDQQIEWGGSTVGLYGNGSTNSLTFFTATTTRATLDSSGNLGIGTSSPGAKLEVASGKVLLSNGQSYAVKSSGGAVNDVIGLTAGNVLILGGGGATDSIQFWNQGLERMRLDSSGNLGLGVTPSAWSVIKAIEIGGFRNSVFSDNGATSIGIASGSYYNSGWKYALTGSVVGRYEIAGNDHRWYTAPSGTAGNAISFTQAMILDASGNLLVGTTSQPSFATSRLVVAYGTADYALALVNSNATPYGMAIGYTGASPNNTSSAFFYCQDSGPTQRFSVRANGGVYNYSANDVNLSDRREKTNFAPAKSYLDTICAIPVQTFNYIDQNMEEDPGKTLGVVAQDVQAVAPELVMESNWGTKDDPKMRLSVYQTDLQYALMKCIQEQQELIKDLRARVAALESQP